jgi:integrase
MAVLLAIVGAHTADRPPGVLDRSVKGWFKLAIWYRDEALLRMMISNPLRNRNLREMTYIPGGDGNLRKVHGRYWLHFKPSDFKNERGAAHRPYKVPVPASLNALLDTYLNVVRPLLLNGRTHDEVFLTRNGGPHDTTGLSGLVHELTTTALAAVGLEMPGFRTHAVRHIVATAWLRAKPGDYLTVAQILHDTLETVLRNYAPPSPQDGLGHFFNWLEPRMPPLGVLH